MIVLADNHVAYEPRDNTKFMDSVELHKNFFNREPTLIYLIISVHAIDSACTPQCGIHIGAGRSARMLTLEATSDNSEVQLINFSEEGDEDSFPLLGGHISLCKPTLFVHKALASKIKFQPAQDDTSPRSG
jgi:hypothetical protein